MSGPHCPLTLSTVQTLDIRFQIQPQHRVHQLVEPGNGQTGAFPKPVRRLAEVFISHHHA
jgi:hypothetical protein